MYLRKVTHEPPKGKGFSLAGYDHFVAIDWSKRVMSIAHMTSRSKHPTVFERPANIIEVRGYLEKLRGRTILAVEETTPAQWLYLELHDSVDTIIICDPYRNHLLSDGPKDDAIDAGKLCLLLRAGLLKNVFHSGSEFYELRRLVSAYDDLVKAGVRIQNQKHALEHGHSETGINTPFIVEHITKALELYRASKKAYEQQFEDLVAKHKLARHLVDVTGIGVIGAVMILATVVDARRFPYAGKYLCYSGLVYHEKLSGGRSYGRRRPRYNHRLKRVYKLAAMAAISGNNPIREYYDALRARGIADHNARHAVARYIARVTYGMLKTGKPYEPYRWRHETPEQQVA